MTTRTFAPWVEPIAEQQRETRARVCEFTWSLPAEAWSKPSPLEGWTCKDLLAHLAGDTDKLFLKLLRSVVSRERVDPALLGEPDASNARDVEERRGRSVEELIAEVEADGEELEELLSRLTEADKDLRQEDIPVSLGEGLSNNPGGHLRVHLEQLRTALEVRS